MVSTLHYNPCLFAVVGPYIELTELTKPDYLNYELYNAYLWPVLVCERSFVNQCYVMNIYWFINPIHNPTDVFNIWYLYIFTFLKKITSIYYVTIKMWRHVKNKNNFTTALEFGGNVRIKAFGIWKLVMKTNALKG